MKIISTFQELESILNESRDLISSEGIQINCELPAGFKIRNVTVDGLLQYEEMVVDGDLTVEALHITSRTKIMGKTTANRIRLSTGTCIFRGGVTTNQMKIG